MAPPKPKPKPPRAELAKALAAAAQWHFSTRNLSEANRRAAEKNYLYVKERIRETGGDLTPDEKEMARGFRAERSARRPPPPRLGDARDRAEAARTRNVARGAAPSGGMGQAERERAVRAFTAPKTKRGEAILGELRKQGFSPPQDEGQAQAQMRQLIKRLEVSERKAIAEQRRRLPPPPKREGPALSWAGKVGDALDWITPERAERPAQIVGGQVSKAGWAITPDVLEPLLRPAVKDIKGLTADAAMAVPAITETIYNDLVGHTKGGAGTRNLAKQMAIGFMHDLERATPYAIQPLDAYKALARGDVSAYVKASRRDLPRAQKQWAEKPVTSLLTVTPFATAAARAATFPAIVRNISRANPEMSKAEVLRAARKESYVPGAGAAKLAKTGGEKGWKGGIPPRLLRGEIRDPVSGETLGPGFEVPARPPSRSALGRGLQNAYDNWSRSEGPLAPGRGPVIGKVTGRFSELHRAARNLERRNKLTHEASRAKLLQQASVVERYIRQAGLGDKTKNVLLGRLAENRARMAETFYGPQGPSGVEAETTLKAIAEDLRDIVEEGGVKGGKPTNALLKINKEIQRIDLRLENLGTPVDLSKGLWAQATNTMRKAGYSQAQIETYQALMIPIAQAWAKREPGRDPNDWLGSEDGRNIAGFEFGTPDAEALEQSLFQVLYPTDADVPMDPNNPYRLNRAAQAEGVPAEFAPEPLPFTTGPEITPAGRVKTTTSSRHTEAQADLHEVWDFVNNRPKEGADPKKAAEIEKLLPDEGRMVTDRDGNEVWVGRTSLQQKDERMTSFMETLDPDQQELFRRWYERTWDYISYLYGPEKMKAFGNAFYASQAAQSPAGGIAMLFRVAEDIAAGKPMPTGKAQWLQRNVWKLMTDEHLGQNPSGLAAKLMDFFASGAGLNMRALYGAMEKIGPGVVDRWTWRSDGYITKTEKGEMMAARVPGVRASPALGSAKGKAVAYEYSNTRLQMLTDMWNREKRFGRDDWTVDQIQAIDWFATKKEWVDNEWTPSSAEGGSPLDMAIHNTREVSFKGDPETLKQVVENAGAGVTLFRGRRAGKEATTSEAEGWTHAIVAGSSKGLDNLEIALGRAGHTYVTKYPGQFGGTATKRSHQIDVPRERREEAAEAVRKAGFKPRDNPSILEWGEDSYRIDFGHGKVARKRADAVSDALGLPVESRFLTKRGRGVRPTVLKQRSAEGIRGAVQFLDTADGRQLIYLSEHADASTFGHELIGHAVHEMKREMPAEFAAVEKRYGKELEDWGEAEHERFATEAERYLMSGKAPTPELQPVFAAMKLWMQAVYETIKALGRPIPPETRRLMDRYFGKEPLDFTPPQRLRRTGRNAFPDPDDEAGVGQLVDDTAALVLRGADVLRQDPKARQQIAGSMKWLEEQVLPYLDQKDPTLAARVHDLFDDYDEVKSGSSIFSADERRLLEARGKLLGKRHAQMRKMEESLGAQPDRVFLDEATRVMAEIDDAETLEDVAEIVKDLKAVVTEAGKRTQFDHESQRLLSRQVKDLERAIDPERKVNKAERDEAIGVLREMSGQMTHWYMDVFGEGLGPEARAMLERSLAVRDNIIPTRLRELGLLDEGTGEGVYMPHYSVFDRLFSRVRGPVRLPAAGANRKVLSTQVRESEAFQKGANKLRRYGTGTAQVDPRALLSAYKNRFRFLETANLRRQLYEIGVEIPKRADGNPRIPEGWYIINGTGEAVPERLKRLATMSEKEIDEMLAAGEDFDSKLVDESGTLDMLEEYRKSWLAKGESKIPGDWQNDKLRMLPPEVVETLVGKVFESTPGGFMQSVGGLLSVAGRVATIFSHPMGYIHANVAANAMLLALTNPARTPRAVLEFFKGPTSLRRSEPRLYEDITVQTGDVASEAGLPSFYVKEQTGMERAERVATAGSRQWASFLGNISDQPFRVASWTGHARKYGYNTPEQWRQLIDSEDPEIRQVREAVAQRTREDMLDFNKLTPQEQRMARYLFIWPFIRAATAQPLWMLREYPGRLAAMSQVADAQQRAYEEMGMESVKSRYNAISPAEDRSMFDLSEVPVGGGSINLGPVNPLGPAAEKFVAAAGVVQNPKNLQAIGELINPAYSSLGEGIFGREMDWAGAGKSIIPLYSYWKAFQDPKHRGAQKYTDRDSFWDYIRRRELRFAPEKIDSAKVKESGEKEAEKTDARPTWEKAQEEDMEAFGKIVAKAVKAGNVPPTTAEEAAIKRSITAYNALDASEKEWKDKLGKTDLDEWDKLRATYDVVQEYYPERYGSLPPLDEVKGWPQTSRKENVNDMKTLRLDIRSKIQAKRSKLMSRGRDLGVVD